MINYNEIKDKYPKAFELLIEWGYNLDIEGVFIDEEFGIIRFGSDEHIFNDRYLYDFFDENKICIEIFRVWIDWNDLTSFLWGGNVNGYNPTPFSEGVGTRQEAETAAFTKAFKLLEGKLLNK